jgi:hypothetical protein
MGCGAVAMCKIPQRTLSVFGVCGVANRLWLTSDLVVQGGPSY